MDAGQLIVEARKRAGITQTELASLMGTHQSVVARWETGKTQPTLETVSKAVQAAGLKLEVSLTGGDDNPTPPIRAKVPIPPAMAEVKQRQAAQAQIIWIKGR